MRDLQMIQPHGVHWRRLLLPAGTVGVAAAGAFLANALDNAETRAQA